MGYVLGIREGGDWPEPREGQNFQMRSFSSNEIIKTRFGDVLVEVVDREYASIEFPRLSVTEQNVYVHGIFTDYEKSVRPLDQRLVQDILEKFKADERKFSAVYVAQNGYLKSPNRYGLQLSALTILANLEDIHRQSQSNRELLQSTDKQKLIEALSNQLQVTYGHIFNVDIEVRIKERPENKNQEPHT